MRKWQGPGLAYRAFTCEVWGNIRGSTIGPTPSTLEKGGFILGGLIEDHYRMKREEDMTIIHDRGKKKRSR